MTVADAPLPDILPIKGEAGSHSKISKGSAMYSSISKMKPPLPRSPMRLRPRRVLHSSTSLQTPPPNGSLTKYQKDPSRSLDVDVEESALRPEYCTISCELRALAKIVRDEFGNADSKNVIAANSCSVNAGAVFERGRFYDEYSARRNERLKRKKGSVTVGEGKPAHALGLGVTIESAKKTSSRKLGSLRKSVSAAYSVEMEVSETPRYMLRSRTKDKKPPLIAANLDKSVLAEKKKMGARRVGRV